MTIYATWIAADQRFAFNPDEGEIKLTNARHAELLRAEGLGNRLQPDPVTGLPIVVARSEETMQDPLIARHADKVREINEACEMAITGGFWSSALGTLHNYSSQLDDQLNLTGAVLNGQPCPYACRDEQGVKAFRPHTTEQLRQVGNDFTLYKLGLLQLAGALKEQSDRALEAGDVVALERVVWSTAP